jgi:hypothetical protein
LRTSREYGLFNALFHNRDIGTDVIAMVAPSEEGVNIMAESFMKATEMRLGHPSSTTHY